MQINIQLLPAVGASHGHWELVDFHDFLILHAPNLSFYIRACLQFPPLHILNEELLSGGKDMGMSGGCLWKPFQITEEEYNKISEEMLTDPKYNLTYDKELAQIKKFRQWSKEIGRRYNPRKRNLDPYLKYIP